MASESARKPKLRPFADVLSRLRHDPGLDLEVSSVVIGYKDRTKPEMQEIPLPRWKSVRKGGEIPEHAVCYLSSPLSGLIWDRHSRLDRIFGSGDTPSSECIGRKSGLSSAESITERPRSKKKGGGTHTSTVPDMGEVRPRVEVQSDGSEVSYEFSFGVVAFRETAESKSDERTRVEFLLVRHTDDHWGFPEGMIREGESPRKCAERELKEQTGVDLESSEHHSIVLWDSPLRLYNEKQQRSHKPRRLTKKWIELYPLRLGRFAEMAQLSETDEIGFFTLRECRSMMRPELSVVLSQLQRTIQSGPFRSKKEHEKCSRALTKVLRHTAEKLGLEMDERGYVDCECLMTAMPSLDLSLPRLQYIAEKCPKQRFSLICESEPMGRPVWRIRANQGHTLTSSTAVRLDPEALLTPLLPRMVESDFPDAGAQICHGSYWKWFPLICESGGLSRMRRNHIHLSPFDSLSEHEGSAVRARSGMRSSCELLLYFDVVAAIDEGWRFFVSQNGVVLTPGDSRGLLPLRFCRKIRAFETGRPARVLWDRATSEIPVDQLTKDSLR